MPRYIRQIPRDLFNEASLLNSIGHLYLKVEDNPNCEVIYDGYDAPFDVYQDPASGDLTVDNLYFVLRGVRMVFSRPLNSRDKHPLYISIEGDDDTRMQVFHADGVMTPDMQHLILGDGND